MSELVTQTAEMLSMLPDEDVSLVNDLVKKLVRAWDPDFSKVTPSEKAKLDQIDKEISEGDFFTENEVW